MVSAEGERVILKNFVTKGDEVEGWFKDIEDKMKESLKIEFKKAVKSLEDDTERKDWVL